MQPLISQVDHESRHNSYNAGEQASEETPLLPRFPNPEPPPPGYKTTIIVSLLIFILIGGVIIGTYLLIIQSNSENILPQADMPPLQLMSRAQWDSRSEYNRTPLAAAPFIAKHIILVQTDTRKCDCLESCINLLNEMVNGSEIQYNFMVAENGDTFEGLGWRRPSQLFPEYATTSLVIAVVGNYTHVPPTRLQMQQSQNLIAESLSQQRLQPDYQVFGKSLSYYPKHLFTAASQLPHWNYELTDKPS